jgi:hypothetical protein
MGRLGGYNSAAVSGDAVNGPNLKILVGIDARVQGDVRTVIAYKMDFYAHCNCP